MQMARHDSHHRPFLVNHPHRDPRAHVHSLLESELQDIRRCLARLEREMANNLVEMRPRQSDDNQRVA